MRKLLTLSALTALALASSAAAAGGGTISIRLRPDREGKHSKLTISASGFTETSLPNSAEILVQKGFNASAKSVARLCANPSACPAASKVGSGVAQVTANVPVLGQVPDTVNLTLYLGKPSHPGDIASVIVIGHDTKYGLTATGSGRLFKDSARRLELLFDHFPTLQNLQGVSVTLNSLSLTAGASRTVTRHHKRVTYSLITNPSTCNGHWRGTATVNFPNQAPVKKPLSTPCTK